MQIVADRYSCTHFELIGPLTVLPKHLYSKEISCTVNVDSPYPTSVFGKGLLPGARRDTTWERTPLHANTICAIKVGDWGFQEMEAHDDSRQGWEVYGSMSRRMSYSCGVRRDSMHVIMVSVRREMMRGTLARDNLSLIHI